ncbi:hypothetical protein HQQ94_05335 [Shewanella sp. VB17]|uniref:hypothetical protein n=1 Tax=Shewanella sp. VB17 TaxID=2739432 RepID=UPI0015656E01|nr:hypothetical protein [Shewanella sp. VB17]NRD72679.1 hypothetical protein [Shewanella sp. VB17]
MFNLITISIVMSLFALAIYFLYLTLKKADLTCSVDASSVNTGLSCEHHYLELIKIAMDRAAAEENKGNIAEYMREIKVCDERLIAISKKISSADKSHLRIAS